MRKETHSQNRKPDTWNTGNSSRLFPLVLLFFFFSGITGLIYEILWTRMIVSIIGSAPFAVSIVLTVFMGGLGLGSYFAGKWVDTVKDPGKLLRTYGLLELSIGAYGLLLPLLLMGFRPLYGLIYNHVFHSFMLYNFLTFIGCVFILILPATFMGATLPVLSRFSIQRLSHVGSHLGQLYGVNTIGAAVGSLLCGFWIIAIWGIWAALGLAIVFNALIGISSISFGQTIRPSKHVPELKVAAQPGEKTYSTAWGTIALAIFAVSGFCAMAYEVIWTRLIELIIGPTTYSFTLTVSIFILGLALGSMFFGWVADRIKHAEFLLAGTQIIAALLVLGVSQALGSSQMFFAKLIFQFQHHFTLLMVMKSAFIFLLLIFPTFALGATFPLVGKIYARSAAAVGRSIGFAYSVNTIGAVLGSFCAGFLLIPFLGKEHSLSLLIFLQLVTALGAVVYGTWKRKEYRLALIPVAVLILIGLGAATRYPHWNRVMLSVGKYHRFDTFAVNTISWHDVFGDFSEKYGKSYGDLVYFGDGAGGFTSVIKTRDLLGNEMFNLFNNGKADASSYGDMLTQTMLAHFPMAFHPNPQSVMVLGLASGITAGEVLHYPIQKLDIVDINEQVVKASGFFLPWNNNVLKDPRTELIIQDARAHMQLTDRRYDVIISEPSNPWMAGVASLFTSEFFDAVYSHLNEGGIFCQWIHAYQIDWQDFSLIGRTFASRFPNGFIATLNLAGDSPDYLLIGTKGGSLDFNTVQRNFQYTRQSTNMKISDPRVFYSMILSENLSSIFGSGPINTDSRPILEFNAPKQMYASDTTIAQNLANNRELKDQTLELMRNFVTDTDFHISIMEFLGSFDIQSRNIIDPAQATPEQLQRYRQAVLDYCGRNVVTDFSFIPDEKIREECIAYHIQKMEEAIPKSPSPEIICTHLGNLMETRGDLKEAIAWYQKAIQENPENDTGYYVCGRAMDESGEKDEAIRLYQKALDLNPKNAYAHNNLGTIYSEQNRINDAILQFLAAIQIDSTLANAHMNLGYALQAQGKINEGEQQIRMGTALLQKQRQ